ncbi:MAG TPA: hypothetical protein PKH07_00145 [bacterium]|nr:hypothetical protein [bacterium]
MKKVCVGFLGVLILGGLLFSQQALSNSRTEDPIGVAVAPQLLILDTVQSGEVTVHTAIPYRSVLKGSVFLNGIAASSTFADSRGQLVAKFKESLVEAIVEPPSAFLTLTGLYLDGSAFSGSETIQVR